MLGIGRMTVVMLGLALLLAGCSGGATSSKPAAQGNRCGDARKAVNAHGAKAEAVGQEPTDGWYGTEPTPVESTEVVYDGLGDQRVVRT
jgi:ABC-type glycerol-3-phosphate transport system substrate-binding protein